MAQNDDPLQRFKQLKFDSQQNPAWYYRVRGDTVQAVWAELERLRAIEFRMKGLEK